MQSEIMVFYMSKHLSIRNKEFSSLNINDWYINKLFYSDEIINDAFYEIVVKYKISSYDSNHFTLDDSELQIVEELVKNDFNILIKALLEYLIASSSKKENSNLIKITEDYIELFFSNIDSFEGGLPLHNLEILLLWTFDRFPKSKNKIRNIMLDYIMQGNVKNIMLLSLVNRLINNNYLMNLFTQKDYENIYNKYLLKKAKTKNINRYIESYKLYLSYLESRNKKRAKIITKQFCEFVINNIELIDNYEKHVLLPQIRDYMFVFDSFSEEDYYIVNTHIQIANKVIMESIKPITIKLTEEESKKIYEAVKLQEIAYSKLNNVQKLLRLLLEMPNISIDEIKHYLEKNKGTLVRYVNERIIDEEGNPINYKKLKPEELFSAKSRRFIKMKVDIYFISDINPFILSFNFDHNVMLFIKEVFKNNMLVSNERKEKITTSFLDFFEQKSENSVMNIVLQLEESLRYYFHKNKINIYVKNGYYIGLGNIFNYLKNNNFRKKLFETIDENFFFALKWLLSDKRGFNLRNKIAHGFGDIDICKSNLAIYTALIIFKLYMGFKI